MSQYIISIEELSKVAKSPFIKAPWNDQNFKLSKRNIKKYIDNRDFSLEPYSSSSKHMHKINKENKSEQKEYHEKRVAYILFNNNKDAITIQCDNNYCHLDDGWHRYSAALYNKETTIVANIFNTYTDHNFPTNGTDVKEKDLTRYFPTAKNVKEALAA